MSCKSCHACGTAVRIVLDSEEWCSTCQTNQPPAQHCLGRRPHQTPLERLSCEDSRRQRLPHRLGRLAKSTSGVRFDLYLSDLDEVDGDVYTPRHQGLDAEELLPLLYIAFYQGADCQVLASAPNPGSAT